MTATDTPASIVMREGERTDAGAGWERDGEPASCSKQLAEPGSVSRAAKGADCKSAGTAFVGSSPTRPT